jgi:hypothetical protein
MPGTLTPRGEPEGLEGSSCTCETLQSEQTGWVRLPVGPQCAFCVGESTDPTSMHYGEGQWPEGP